jgi:hypothetical protein
MAGRTKAHISITKARSAVTNGLHILEGVDHRSEALGAIHRTSGEHQSKVDYHASEAQYSHDHYTDAIDRSIAAENAGDEKGAAAARKEAAIHHKDKIFHLREAGKLRRQGPEFNKSYIEPLEKAWSTKRPRMFRAPGTRGAQQSPSLLVRPGVTRSAATGIRMGPRIRSPGYIPTIAPRRAVVRTRGDRLRKMMMIAPLGA